MLRKKTSGVKSFFIRIVYKGELVLLSGVVVVAGLFDFKPTPKMGAEGF